MNEHPNKRSGLATNGQATKAKRIGLSNPHAICYINAIVQATFPMKETWAASIKGTQLEVTWRAMVASGQAALGPKFGLDIRDSIPGFQDSHEQQDVQEALSQLFSTFDPAAVTCHQHTYVTKTMCETCEQTTTHRDEIRDITIANGETTVQDAVFGERDPEQLEVPAH